MTHRITLVDPSTAQGRTKQLLDGVAKKMGKVPNMMRALSNSPAVLDAYLAFSGALAKTDLSAQIREQIAIAVAEVNGCDYCLSAHSTLGSAQGLSADDIAKARRGDASDPHAKGVLTLARQLVLNRGNVSDADLRQARSAGLSDGEIAEVVAVTSLNIFTNYFNHVADPEIDFPVVKTGDAEVCATGSGSVESGAV